jgi:hypothetical protein
MQQSRACKIAVAPAKPAKAAKEGSHFSNCSDFSVGAPNILLCSVCGDRPRLGTLSRCRQCISASAEQDRDTRAAAETRVVTRKVLDAKSLAGEERNACSRPAGESAAGNSPTAGTHPAKKANRPPRTQFGATPRSPSHCNLEAMATHVLANPEAVLALEQAGADLLKPSNDRRQQIADMLANEDDRAWIENQLGEVHITEAAGKVWVTLGLENNRDRPAGMEVGRRSQRLFRVRKLYHHEDPKDATRFADRPKKQPTRDSFGRTKRSLPGRER